MRPVPVAPAPAPAHFRRSASFALRSASCRRCSSSRACRSASSASRRSFSAAFLALSFSCMCKSGQEAMHND